MAEVTWGRKESIVWPPHKPIYTLGALFLALIATGFFVYLRFQPGMQRRAMSSRARRLNHLASRSRSNCPIPHGGEA